MKNLLKPQPKDLMTAPTKMWVLLFLEHLLNVGNVLLVYTTLTSHLSDKIARILPICHILKSCHKLTYLWILLHKHLQNHLRISPRVFHSENTLQGLVNICVSIKICVHFPKSPLKFQILVGFALLPLLGHWACFWVAVVLGLSSLLCISFSFSKTSLSLSAVTKPHFLI